MNSLYEIFLDISRFYIKRKSQKYWSLQKWSTSHLRERGYFGYNKGNNSDFKPSFEHLPTTYTK